MVTFPFFFTWFTIFRMNIRTTFRLSLAVSAIVWASGCAHLHSAKIGERRLPPENATAFESKVNETGFNVQEATAIVKAVAGSKSGISKGADTVNKIYEWISFGPKTGNTVLDDKYADNSGKVAQMKCSPNRTVGVVTYRETMKYPVISGEIVKIEGLCK